MKIAAVAFAAALAAYATIAYKIINEIARYIEEQETSS